jgi:protein-disulfide isomerase/uncharacterized membrane protein
MNKKYAVVIIGILLAILTHAYLTNHYYPLKYGMAPTESFCKMGDKLDCDVAAASAYSNIFGVPLSVFGIVFHFLLLLLVVGVWTGLVERRERTLRVATGLAGASALGSIFLAVISATQLAAWCPFCILAYVFSFIIFCGLWMLLDSPFGQIKQDIPALFTESRGLLISILAIPLVSYVTHKAITQNYGGAQLDAVVKSSVNEWLVSPAVNFEAFPPALVKGPEADQAKMTLVEFADFRCGHCGQAAPSVHAFLKSHTDVRFMFFNFPLDGECNEEIGSGDGVSCRLAKATTCAGEMDMTKGFFVHDQIFKKQTEFQTIRQVSEADQKLQAIATESGVEWTQLLACMDSPDTQEKIKSQIAAGKEAKIRGTPTFYVNGKLLSRGQYIPVLKGVYEAASKEAK